MATERWDAIVIGAGHNGLVAANFIAREGHKVLVLERRAEAGGQIAPAAFADGTRYDDIHFVIVTNTDPWTYVFDRPLRPTPETDFDSGLGLYARRRMGMAGMLFSMARLSGNRPHVGRRGAHLHHDLDGLTVLADEPMPVQVDGDYLEFREKATFRSTHNAISIVV